MKFCVCWHFFPKLINYTIHEKEAVRTHGNENPPTSSRRWREINKEIVTQVNYEKIIVVVLVMSLADQNAPMR